MTAQISDALTIDGETVRLMSCPELPWDHPRFRRLTMKEAQEAARGTLVFSSACWRQYVARWAIRDDQLFLEGIDGIYGLSGTEPLFADWVIEPLRISKGDMLTYVHMGFGSVYEEDLLLIIRRGRVVMSSVRDNRGKIHDERRLSWEHLPSPETVTPGLKTEKP